MSSSKYSIRLVKVDGSVLESPATFTSLNYSKTLNAPGALSMSFLVDGSVDLVSLFPEDTRLMVWREVDKFGQRLDLDAVWFVTSAVMNHGQDRKRTFDIKAKSALDLASRKLVAYAAGAAQATISGAAADMMKRVVTENLGASAGTGRIIPGLTVQANSSQGATINKQVGWRNVLQTIQECARDSESQGTALYFDIISTGTNTMEFRVWLGQPGAIRTSPVLSLEAGTLSAGSWGFDRDGPNVIYALGQEFGGARQVVSASHSTAAATPFSRREESIEARNAGLTSQLQAEANAEMQRRKPKDVVVATVANTEGALYGVHWNFGDRIDVLINGKRYTCLVEGVQVQVSGGKEQISATLRY